MHHLELVSVKRGTNTIQSIYPNYYNMSYDYMIGGDFNCVLHRSDFTGNPIISKPLTTLTHRCNLVDAWNSTLNSTGYTHYTNTGASRIDRIYMSPTVKARKIHTTTLAAAFTHHNAVKVKIYGTQSPHKHGHSYWKLNAALLTMEGPKDQFRPRDGNKSKRGTAIQDDGGVHTQNARYNDFSK